jgi:glycerate kinase
VRILLCPDKFAGSLDAPEVARALAEGWRTVAPGDELTLRPLSDGGPGFVEVLDGALQGRRVPVRTVDPLGRPAPGEIVLDGTTGYVESAQATGLHLLAAPERDPCVTSSFGLGLLLTGAVAAGARRVVVGLGGSGTNDGGAGMLAALGLVLLDAGGESLPPGGAALGRAVGLRVPPGGVALAGTELVGAADVDNPLTGPSGASAVYGPQKGADEADVEVLDAALTRMARVLVRDLPGCPADFADRPGAGAAGGIGGALLALGGRIESGVGLVRRLAGLDQLIAGCDLVVTGEGRFDQQSLRGKLVTGIAGAAHEAGRPCVVVAGQDSTGRREAAAAGVGEVHTLVGYFGDERQAMEHAAEGLRAIGARLAKRWSRS